MEDDSKPGDQVANQEVAEKPAEPVAEAAAPTAKTECPEVAADDGTEESPPKKAKTTDEAAAELAAETTETAKAT